MQVSEIKEKLQKIKASADLLSKYVADMIAGLEANADVKQPPTRSGWDTVYLDAKCPECGHPQVYKTNLETGRIFFGCSDFPHCKWSKESDQIDCGISPFVDNDWEG